MSTEPKRQNDVSEHSSSTLSDGVAEAKRLIVVMQEQAIPMRLLGGVAIRLRCPSAAHRALHRSYADLDFASIRKSSRALKNYLSTNGYAPDYQFNALHGKHRLLFYDEARSRQIDIFLDTFEMCHTLDFSRRLTFHSLTLSPADLLLTKLQIVQMNAKDIQDILALLLDFEPKMTTAIPGDDLDISMIARLCGQEWGWFTTVNDNLDHIGSIATKFLNAEEVTRVAQRIASMKRVLEEAPKSLAWHVRAKIGRRMPWYELPEEVH